MGNNTVTTGSNQHQRTDMRATSHARVVVKVGTSVLTAGTDKLHRPFMVDMARQIATLHHRGTHVLLVSSGAVAAGWERLGYPARQHYKKDAAVSFKQVLAAVGQSYLMHLYEQLFDIYGLHVAQALLTKEDLGDRRRYLNARNTLLHSLEHGIVPIINENDAVATDEIRVGDNDTLSALVANVVDADLLIILTDIDGLYTADPRKHADATLLHTIHTIDEYVWHIAGGAGTHRGTGGMHTKIRAADLATRSGTSVVIANGTIPDAISRIAAGEQLGTLFPTNISGVESRKRWLLAEMVHHSKVVVDDGAATALLHHGCSLLAAGITAVEGHFERGQTIRIYDVHNHEIARGITQYCATDLVLIKGIHSSHIADILGYAFGDEVVHRDDMVIVQL